MANDEFCVEAPNVIHEFSERQQDKNAILSCSLFSMAYQPLEMATHPCVADTLNESGVSLVVKICFKPVKSQIDGFLVNAVGHANMVFARRPECTARGQGDPGLFQQLQAKLT